MALVDGADAFDVKLLTMAVAAPLQLGFMSTGDDDWIMAVKDQDLVMLGGQDPTAGLIARVQEVRASTTAAVVLVGTRSADADRIELLDAGADDVVPEPVDAIELGARLRGILRRTLPEMAMSPVEWVGSHIVSFEDRRAWNLTTGRRLQLSPSQWQVLAALLRRPGGTVEVDRLQAEVWGDAAGGRDAYVRQYIVQLRRKLESDPRHPRHLLTVHGRGYRYER